MLADCVARMTDQQPPDDGHTIQLGEVTVGQPDTEPSGEERVAEITISFPITSTDYLDRAAILDAVMNRGEIPDEAIGAMRVLPPEPPAQPEAASERCPTCDAGSRDYTGDVDGDGWKECLDPWHDPPASPQREGWIAVCFDCGNFDGWEAGPLHEKDCPALSRSQWEPSEHLFVPASERDSLERERDNYRAIGEETELRLAEQLQQARDDGCKLADRLARAERTAADYRDKYIEIGVRRNDELREAEVLAESLAELAYAPFPTFCSCGKSHTAAFGTGGDPGPDCKPLPYRDLYEHHRDAANQRRKEGTEAIRERDSLAEQLHDAQEEAASYSRGIESLTQQRDELREGLRDALSRLDRISRLPCQFPDDPEETRKLAATYIDVLGIMADYDQIGNAATLDRLSPTPEDSDARTH